MAEKLLCNNKPVHYYSLNRNIFILALIKNCQRRTMKSVSNITEKETDEK